MAELGESGRRKTRMKVREAQAEMLALLPEMEALAARFRAINDKLDAGDRSDSFIDGRPGRDHLRFWVACEARETAYELLKLVVQTRKGAQETHENLLAKWEERQKKERERELSGRSRSFGYMFDLF